ncbi:MAG: transporter small multidrug resistance family protein [Marmoricola sp.]|nr:transporter small multidrug resistance family protein [Marmoricola sp.]
MTWLFLGAAILVEVGAVLALRQSDGMTRRVWIGPVVVGYLAAFALLWLTLDSGMAVGVAYGVWAATGVALTAIAGRVLFKDPLTPLMLLGIAAIAGGVLLIELGAH